MLNNINNDGGLILNSQLQQGEQLQSADAIKEVKNPYQKANMFVDKGDISKQALELYEKEQEIEKYKNILLEELTEEDANKEVASLIEKGVFEISDDEIAESMMLDDNLFNELFQ